MPRPDGFDPGPKVDAVLAGREVTQVNEQCDGLVVALGLPFTFRKTHALPTNVPAPLAAWTTPYAAMAREDQLAWPALDEVIKAAQTFLDPILAGELDATWEPETWSW